MSVTCYFEKKRSFATGIAVCGSGLGTFLFAPLTSHLVSEYSWKGALLIIAGLTLNCILFGALFRPLERPRVRRNQLEELAEEDEEVPAVPAEREMLMAIREEPQKSWSNSIIW